MNNKITGLLFYGENKLRENDRYFRYREKQSGESIGDSVTCFSRS